MQTIDLDTIDVSNLNRQFLFRTHHVSMSKAKVLSRIVIAFIRKWLLTSVIFLLGRGRVCDGFQPSSNRDSTSWKYF